MLVTSLAISCHLHIQSILPNDVGFCRSQSRPTDGSKSRYVYLLLVRVNPVHDFGNNAKQGAFAVCFYVIGRRTVIAVEHDSVATQWMSISTRIIVCFVVENSMD
jgi:hypothetical protein